MYRAFSTAIMIWFWMFSSSAAISRANAMMSKLICLIEPLPRMSSKFGILPCSNDLPRLVFLK